MPKSDDIATKPHVYSWSTKVEFVLNSVGGIKDVEAEPVRVPWDEELILTLENQAIHPNLGGGGATGYRFTLDAAQTAGEAEELGIRLTCALLKVVIDRNWGLRLSWPDTPLPCRVIDRMASRGDSVQAFMTSTSQLTLLEFTSRLQENFARLVAAPYRLLLSMELCASARFETDSRAKLILMISALEAIVEQQNLTNGIDVLVDKLTTVINDHDVKDESIKSSLMTQVGNLKRESIRRAIRRKLTDAGLSGEDLEFVEKAYGVRSKIVHEGHRIPELSKMIVGLERVMRCVYSHEMST